MALTSSDTIIGPSRGTAAAAKASFRARGALRIGDVDAYVDAVYALCAPDDMPDAAIVVSAADVETGTFTNKWWKERLNAGSLGVTGWPPEDAISPTFTSGAAAAKAHVAHLLLYATGQINRGGLTPADDPRFAAYREVFGTKAYPTINDLSGRYAADTGYGVTIARRSQVVYGELPDQFTLPVEEPDMALPAAPPLRISIMPYGNANRPKLEMASPSYITVHEVGNTSPGADEEMHRQFVHNGGGSSQVSFQFVVGPTEAIQLMPIDEAAWHASDGYNGTGNRDSIAIETIQIGNFDKTLWHLAWLINELATNPNRFYHNQPRQWDLSIEKIKQHHDWAPDGKNCPQFIRDRGLWPELMRRVDAWNAASTPAPPPDPKPDPEPEPTPEPAKHTLPKGMSVQLASRLFGAYAAPWDDTLFRFDLDQAPSQVWLSRGKASIQTGKTWADGNWPELNVVIRRGDGGQVWVWSDGSTYERKP